MQSAAFQGGTSCIKDSAAFSFDEPQGYLLLFTCKLILGTLSPRVAGVAQANRDLVADQLAATTGEDRRTAGKACPLLLAFAGGGPSDEAALWEYGAADRGAVASEWIAKAVEPGNSIQSQERTERCLTKSDGKAGPAGWYILYVIANGIPGVAPGSFQGSPNNVQVVYP